MGEATEYCMSHKEREFVSGLNCANIKEIQGEIDNKIYPLIHSKVSIKILIVILGFLVSFLAGSFTLLYNQSYKNGEQIALVLTTLTGKISELDYNQKTMHQKFEEWMKFAPPEHHHDKDGRVIKNVK